MITLSTIKSELKLFHVNQTIGSRVNDWVYWVLCDIVASNDYWWNKKTATLTTVSGAAEYFLNHRVNMKQLKRFYDTTNNNVIDEVPLEDIYSYDPTPTETGTPTKWAFINQAEVQAVASSAATVSVVSGSTADLSQKVVIRGLVSGIERIEELTLNGTTAVAGTLTWAAGEIESCVLSATCTGTITVTSSATTIVAIPPGYLRIQCPKIRFQLVPNGTYSLTYIFYQTPVRPSSDNDIIDLPDEAFKALRYGLEEIGHYNNGDIDFSSAASRKYAEAKRELAIWSQRNLNQNEVKDYATAAPTGYRWPPTITYVVSS